MIAGFIYTIILLNIIPKRVFCFVLGAQSFCDERILNNIYKQLNRQRSVFPSDKALLKALYMSTMQAAKKWTAPFWGAVYGEFCIMYEGRLPD